MTEAAKIKWFYAIGALFMLLTAYSVLNDDYRFHLLPLILVFLYLVLFRLDLVLLGLNFLIPLAVQFDDVGFGLGISLPDEPLMMLIMFLSVFRFIVDGNYDKRVFRHPVTIWILLNLLWHYITAATSEMPLVSFKYALSRTWFLVCFYFLGIMLFRNFSNIGRYLWLYMASLTFVALYTIYMHGREGFTQETSYHISMPFYIAHGVYSAALAFFVPLLVAYLVYAFPLRLNWLTVLTCILVLAIYLTGIFFSYTRAAWLSIVVATAMVIPLLLKIKLRTQLGILVGCLCIFLAFQNQILYALSKNTQDSAEGFSSHLQSASNIKTDASNIERINRWMSAVNMFRERPVFGFGPGTYPFQYAPYQEARFRTIISTNFGNQGNAHNELLNPLAELGLFGSLSLFMIVFYGLNTAFNLIYSGVNVRNRLFLVGMSLAILGYFAHGMLNNYTDSSKIAPLLWGGLAIIVAIDLYHTGQRKPEPASPAPHQSLNKQL